MLNPDLFISSLPEVLKGLPVTLGMALLSFLSASLLGIGIAACRLSSLKALVLLSRAFISLMRGVPMLVVIFLLYFGLPYVGIELPALLAAYLSFSVVASAYIAEIFRAAISAISPGQWEAAYSLGLSRRLTFRRVILPQAIRIAIPSLGNVFLDMLKSTSLMAMITVHDIFQNAMIIGGREWDYMTMYLLVALIYWLLCLLFEIIQHRIERRYPIYS